MKIEDITAEWARKEATTILGEKIKKEINICLIAVEKAVTKNEMSVNVPGSFDTLTIADLVKRGFKTSYYQGDFRDPREVGYTTISW